MPSHNGKDSILCTLSKSNCKKIDKVSNTKLPGWHIKHTVKDICKNCGLLSETFSTACQNHDNDLTKHRLDNSMVSHSRNCCKSVFATTMKYRLSLTWNILQFKGSCGFIYNSGTYWCTGATVTYNCSKFVKTNTGTGILVVSKC